MPPLNLASRPFRNERLPALLLVLGFTVAGAITVKHVLAIHRLLPGRTSGLAREVASLEGEGARLREQAGRLRAPRPEHAAVAQWAMLKELVDRRTFSWSGLFAVLEQVLPAGVRLVSISPTVKDGQMTLELTAVARSNEDALELIRVLEERPEFEDVLPRARTSNEAETEFRYTMRYTSTAPPPPAAVAALGPAPAGVAQPSPASPASPPPSEPQRPTAVDARGERIE